MDRRKERWNVEDDVLSSDIQVNELIDALRVIEKLTDKYPADETLLSTIDILRDEVCIQFGGSVSVEDYISE